MGWHCLTWNLYFAIPFVLAILIAPYHAPSFGINEKSGGDPLRILLLTAHPDDECMFFAPTLLALSGFARRPTPSVIQSPVVRSHELYSLCLSSGDAHGLGEVRKQELAASLDVLGIPQQRHWVLDKPFQDNMTLFWDTQLIVEHLKPYVLRHKIDIVCIRYITTRLIETDKYFFDSPKTGTTYSMTVFLDKILTFDEFGISSHPNHISLERGVQAFISEEGILQKSESEDHVLAFKLTTISILPKYLGFGDAFTKRLQMGICTAFISKWRVLRRLYGNACMEMEQRTFLSSYREYWTALKAMRQHRSQLVWFRWLYVAFSRYMWVNEWEEILP